MRMSLEFCSERYSSEVSMDSRKFLSPEEREYLESFLLARAETDTRNVAIILTALHSGARSCELLNLSWADINTDSGEIFLNTLKGGRPRPVVVPRAVRELLKRLRTLSPDRPFDISYSRLVEIWNEYRTVRKPFRCLRHSFAMRAYQRTQDIRFVQKALGHRSIANTMIYLEYEYSAQEFKKLMRVR